MHKGSRSGRIRGFWWEPISGTACPHPPSYTHSKMALPAGPETPPSSSGARWPSSCPNRRAAGPTWQRRVTAGSAAAGDTCAPRQYATGGGWSSPVPGGLHPAPHSCTSRSGCRPQHPWASCRRPPCLCSRRRKSSRMHACSHQKHDTLDSSGIVAHQVIQGLGWDVINMVRALEGSWSF